MMNGGQLYGRSMAFPPRVAADGRMAWSEGETNVRESIRIILKTEQGERLNLPDFGAGLQRYLFEPNTVTTRFQIEDQITKALLLWEPRISVTGVSVEQDPTETQSAIAAIEYKLVSTGIQERVTLRLNLGS
jgi:phage baseplate assembly protein W